MVNRNRWDNVVIVSRDGDDDATWDGKVKNLVYDVDTLSWIAQTQSGGGGGGGGDASAANQVTGNASLASIDAKTPALEYAVKSDDVGGGVVYFGYATVGTSAASASWKIKKVTETDGDLEITFADGNANFDNTWNDRVSLSYS